MSDKQILLQNIDKIHTTEMGVDRIRKNLKISDADVVKFCKNKILSPDCNIYKEGKNWYCEIDGIQITVNSFNFSIITAHKGTGLKNKPKNTELIARIDEVLFYLWDPIGISDRIETRDEYSGYIPEIINLLETGKQTEIANLLNSIQTDRMCRQSNLEHCTRIADKIIQWDYYLKKK